MSHCFSLPSPYTLPPPFLPPSNLPSHVPDMASLYLPFLAFSLLFPSLPFLSILAFPLPLQMEKLLLPAVDLEQWYQELMSGLGTGLAAASPRSSPPPLPAKASRQLQVTLTACLLQVLFCLLWAPLPILLERCISRIMGSAQQSKEGPWGPERAPRLFSWAAMLSF